MLFDHDDKKHGRGPAESNSLDLSPIAMKKILTESSSTASSSEKFAQYTHIYFNCDLSGIINSSS